MKETGWRVDKDTLPAIHDFGSATTGARSPEARVDVSGLVETVQIYLVNGAVDVCNTSLDLVSFPSMTGTRVIVVLPKVNNSYRQWPAISAGTIKLSPTLSVVNAFVAPGSDAVSLSGQIVLAGNVHSRSTLTLSVSTKNTSQSSGDGQIALNYNGSIAFDVGSSATDLYTVNVTSLSCKNLGVAECAVNATLQLPGTEKTGDVASSITLSLGEDGIFRLSGANDKIYLDKEKDKVIELTTFQIDPSKSANASVTASGTLLIGTTTKFEIRDLSFRSSTDELGFTPSGTIVFSDDQNLALGDSITVSHLSGTASLQFDAKEPAVFEATATLKFSLAGGTSVTIRVENLKLRATEDPLTAIRNRNISTWEPDFSQVVVVPEVGISSILNHQLAACPNPTAATPDPEVTNQKQFCIGIHLTDGKVERADDIAYAYASFYQVLPSLKLRSLAFTLPAKPPTTLALAGASVELSALRIDVNDSSDGQYGGFDADIDPALLQDMQCDRIDVAGEAEISGLTIGSMSMQKVAVTPRLGFGKHCTAFALHGILPLQLSPQSNLLLTSLVYLHTTQTFEPKTEPAPAKATATPEPPDYKDAVVSPDDSGTSVPSPEAQETPTGDPSAIRSPAPISEPTSEATAVLSAMASAEPTVLRTPIAVSSPDKSKPAALPEVKKFTVVLDYLKASGSFTSGNITVFFNGIGFRTFYPHTDPNHQNDCDQKNRREYRIPGTHLCAIVDVNLPMTLAATGAQNISAIEGAVEKASSGALGFLIGKFK